MKLLKLFCVGPLLCPVVCLLLETATPPSALLTFEVKEKAGLKSGAVSVFAIRMNAPDFERQKTQVSGLQRSRISKLKNHLSDFFKSSIPLAAIFGFFVTIALMEAAIENKGLEEPPRQWTMGQKSPPRMQNLNLIKVCLAGIQNSYSLVSLIVPRFQIGMFMMVTIL
ncbi:small integral membrane protein 9 [Peromyscus californicus insignis]|uniref:small integral membrane protein 9 n=1 Tax=Peromyscus californicus insignis TaxID=564181 RepID=UPI0022A796FE|nr:small integral membrane protein 9 [Peromyscus californicus insignis]